MSFEGQEAVTQTRVSLLQQQGWMACLQTAMTESFIRTGLHSTEKEDKKTKQKKK